ncbi:MAG TPA: putative selenate reductase subunit YgfK [Clostridia bacterium]|nr:putative selenate reductase subunit YgfK [Clostridia bacterium]
MSDIMRPISFANLIDWSLSEYKKQGRVFGLDKSKFYVNQSGNRLVTPFGDKIASAIGPAAGPHSQLAQNIIVSYLAGARFIELKTVQKMDGEEIRQAVAKPCINAEDECYNCEWSTELTVEEAFDEYVKAWIAIKVLAVEFGLSDGDDFAFNMSLGYDLEGIKLPKMDAFIEGLKDASDSPVFREAIAFLKNHLDSFENVDGAVIEAISPSICHSATLSTLHGCPPDEIERIAHYLLTEKHVDTFVKCNPTMLGYEYVRKTLDDLGYDYIAFPDNHFLEDLQFDDAVGIFTRMTEVARKHNLAFGVKLSNTCPVDTKRDELPSEEMYMSGRALMPLTISLAVKLSQAFDGNLPISYAGGVDAFNLKDLLNVGISPVTVASTLLKPGGYMRFSQMARETESALDTAGKIDIEKLEKLAAETLVDPRMQKRWREKVASRKTDSELPLYDCFKAPCKDGGCPIEQQIPEYNTLVARGEYDEAMRVIAIDNACPTITGELCAQPCREYCTRLDYDESLHMRDIKKKAADEAQDSLIEKTQANPLRSDKKVCVVGAGPGGMAAAYYLRRNGIATDVYEKRAASHGIVRYAIPSFRISQEEIDRDYRLVEAVGVNFHFNADPDVDLAALKNSYDYLVVATGAWAQSRSPVSEGKEKVVDALDFLVGVKESGPRDLGKRVAVVGAGDVAMDAARLAKRMPGDPEVTIVYRRTEMYAPASQDEFDGAMEEDVIWRELLAPVSYDGAKLVCEKQCLGSFDESGRRACLGTGEFETLEFDTVIGATGARVDKSLFEKSGMNVDRYGNPRMSDAMETSLEGIYVIGDCRKGPSTVVAAMGDAKKAALDILEREGLEHDFARVSVPVDEAVIVERRGELAGARLPSEEGLRCLICDQVCRICTEVCPNRANVAIPVEGFQDHEQIVHIDGMCNECGNCATFCPHAGKPYKDKLTVFWSEEDFADSENIGFLSLPGGNYRIRDDRGRVFDAPATSLEQEAGKQMTAVIMAVTKNYPWLLNSEL